MKIYIYSCTYFPQSASILLSLKTKTPHLVARKAGRTGKPFLDWQNRNLGCQTIRPKHYFESWKTRPVIPQVCRSQKNSHGIYAAWVKRCIRTNLPPISCLALFFFHEHLNCLGSQTTSHRLAVKNRGLATNAGIVVT